MKKLKDLFKKLLSIRTIVSKALNLFLLDYQKDKDNIKTNYGGLRLYGGALFEQIEEKCEKAKKLKNDILSNI